MAAARPKTTAVVCPFLGTTVTHITIENHVIPNETFCASPSKDTRAYLIRDSNNNYVVEIYHLDSDQSIQISEKEPLRAAALSPSGELVTASRSSLTFWTGIASLTPCASRTKPIQNYPAIMSMVFSPAGKLFTSHSVGRIYYSWEGEDEIPKLLTIAQEFPYLHIDKMGNVTCFSTYFLRNSSIYYISDVCSTPVRNFQCEDFWYFPRLARLNKDWVAYTVTQNGKREIKVRNFETKNEFIVKKIDSELFDKQISHLSVSPDDLLTSINREGLVEVFEVEEDKSQEITSFNITDIGSPVIFWNSFGSFTCVGQYGIIDFKLEIKNYFSEAVSTHLPRDPKNIVMSFLFFKPLEKKWGEEVEQNTDCHSRVGGNPLPTMQHGS